MKGWKFMFEKNFKTYSRSALAFSMAICGCLMGASKTWAVKIPEGVVLPIKEKNSIPEGTSDFIGINARLRDYILEVVKKYYEKFGFEPLYTPMVENAEVFNGHHGEGEKLLFKLYDKLGKPLVLKYDSTVPLARVVSMHPEMKMPYKRYQLQPSFRDDEIDRGHFREFIQCDGDIVGSESLVSDSEFVVIAYKVLNELGFKDFTLRLNHRKIIQGIAEKAGVNDKEGLLEIQRAIDYADKITKNGLDGIRSDLARRGVTPKVIECILELVECVTDNVDQSLNNVELKMKDYPIALEGVKELREITAYLPKEVLDKSKVDFTLARGADYYTGFIIEGKINNIKLGAVLGGGRYDNLVAAFSGNRVPAVGMAFGLERIISAMEELGLDKNQEIVPKKVVVACKSDNQKNMSEIMEVINDLRSDFDVDVLYEASNEDIKNCYEERNSNLVISIADSKEANLIYNSGDKEFFEHVLSKLANLGVKVSN